MVEPIDAQNMLARTPLIEKAAATQKESALQLNQLTSQVEKEKQHQHENVQLKRETLRPEDREGQKTQTGSGGQGKKEADEDAKERGVELVREPAETPEHRLDVMI